MILKAVLAVFLSSFLISVQSNPVKNVTNVSTCGKKLSVGQGNSIGGKPTARNSFPWLVAFRLRPKNQFFCGGSLVSIRHVVSAAHCFHEKNVETMKAPQEVLALLGRHDLYDDEEENSVDRAVNDLVIHEEWNYEAGDFDADIALVVLENEVNLANPVINVICLPSQNKNGVVTGNGTVVGWGISERSIADGVTYDSKPNELKLPAVTREECTDASYDLDIISSDRTFCAGYLNQNKSACQGDSGGGFYLYDTSKKAFNLSGIVSSSLFTEDHCRIDMYSVFTDVSKYVDWLQGKMEETTEIKWTEVKFQCDKGKDGVLRCNHKFNDSKIKKNLKIQVSDARAATATNVGVNFIPANFIFSGISEKFPKTENLFINDQQLKFVERENFKNLQNLERLLLYKNDIEFLPEDVFWDLPNLVYLDISLNHVSTLSEKTFINLKKMKEIHFNDNKFTMLPDELFSENMLLEKIYAYNNPMNQFNVDLSRISGVKLYNETYDNHYYSANGIVTTSFP